MRMQNIQKVSKNANIWLSELEKTGLVPKLSRRRCAETVVMVDVLFEPVFSVETSSTLPTISKGAESLDAMLTLSVLL